jgi:hypothetical protein
VGIAWQPFLNSARPLVVRGGFGVYYDKQNSRFVNLQLLNIPYYMLAQAFFTPIANPFVQVPGPSQFPLAFNSKTVFPLGGPPALLPAEVAGGVQPVSANAIVPDIHKFQTPYVYQYSLGIQNEFASNWLLDVSYVGTAGRKLLRTVDLNQPIAPSAVATGPLSPGLSDLVVQAFGFHAVQSSATSHYDSLQASVSKRIRSGLQLVAAYTWAHSIDDYSGDPSGTSDVTVVAGNQVTLPNRGNSDFDRRQRIVFAGDYELPSLYWGGSHLARKTANGWRVSSIITLQTGTPFSVLTDSTPFVSARADYTSATCNPNLSGSALSRLDRYFNLSCFTAATVAGDFGTSGRNILYGPGQKNVDLAIAKRFGLTDKASLEFRSEFFNTFNNVNLANPINLLSNPNVGAIVATTTGPRVVQFALKLSF